MRSVLIGLAAAFMLAATGCNEHTITKNACSSCSSCGSGCSVHGGHGYAGHGSGAGGAVANHLGTPGPTPVGRLPQGYMQDAGPGGPPSASYGYPYYTTRAPRDFLMNNPPSIGY